MVPFGTGDPERDIKTRPEFLNPGRSKIPDANTGIWTEKDLPARQRFGPYEGTITPDRRQATSSGYSWEDEPPPEPVRRLRGRGRAAGLSSHEDALPVPGEFTNIGVTNLSIQEQIHRVRGTLPIYEPPTDYSQYILPHRSFDDDEAPQPERTADATPPRKVVSNVTAGPSRRGGWAEVLDPGGEVAAGDSALLPRNMTDGGGDAGLRALQRYTQGLTGDSDDPDVLELRTNSSDSSNEFEPVRAWRPRPPPLNEQSFPPLPGAAPAPAPGPVPVRSPSKSERSSSGARSAAGGGDDPATQPAAQPQKRGGRKPRPPANAAMLAAAAGDGPATPPKRRGGRSPRQKPTVASPPSADPPTVSPSTTTTAATASRRSARAAVLPATSGLAPEEGAVPAAEDTPSGRVRVTGVTASNWDEVQQYVSQYGTVRQPRRGSDDDGWFTVSPAESAEWMVSVHSGTPCDIAGVAFHLAEQTGDQ